MQVIARLFPVWLVLGGALALLHPALFIWFLHGGLITPALGLIMLAMGMTLEPRDLVRIRQRPWPVLVGLALQYAVMPASGWLVAHTFQFSEPFAAGLILVCCCPGGTASNVIAYLARADVLLSVTLTAVSTLVAPLATPVLATLLIGDRIQVDGSGLVKDALYVVLLPVLLGLGIRRLVPRVARRINDVAAPLAALLIVLIVAAILAASRGALLSSGLPLVAGVVTAHTVGFAIGYVCGKLLFPELAARTLSIEVGMQNSGLGVVLARGNFTDPLVAVPSAISSIVHSLLGSALAAIWSGSAPGSIENEVTPQD